MSIWGSLGLKVGFGDAVDEVTVDGKEAEVVVDMLVVMGVLVVAIVFEVELSEVVDGGVQVLVEVVVDGRGVDVVETPLP